MKKRIAIIEDDHQACRSLEALLHSYSFESLSFESAENFLADEQRNSFHCLLVDLHLPGINGVDLLFENLMLDIHTPLILITGAHSEHTQERAMKNGAFAVFEKPVDPEELIACIHRAIENSSSFSN